MPTTKIMIPARLESTRLPRKLLLAESGKPLIQHTWERAMETGLPVTIVTGCEEIRKACTAFGAEVIYRAGFWPNGTSRVAAVAKDDTICILQGDEPEMPADLILATIRRLERRDKVQIATAAVRNDSQVITHDFRRDPTKVKVLANYLGDVYDFQRQVVGVVSGMNIGLHIGIYAFHRTDLLRYAMESPSKREVAESLEQLRAMQMGMKFGLVWWMGEHHGGIDTREDYDNFLKRQK